MAEIFINFRAADEPGFAVLLHRELTRAFGERAVFFAGSAIRPGEDFEVRLLESVRQAAVLLVVVGSRWLTAPDPCGGGRAVDNPGDWVRREVAEALSQGARVIPLLIDDAERLTHARLPLDIDQLRRCQYLRLRHDNVDYDIARIVDSLLVTVTVEGHHSCHKATSCYSRNDPPPSPRSPCRAMEGSDRASARSV